MCAGKSHEEREMEDRPEAYTGILKGRKHHLGNICNGSAPGNQMEEIG